MNIINAMPSYCDLCLQTAEKHGICLLTLYILATQDGTPLMIFITHRKTSIALIALQTIDRPGILVIVIVRAQVSALFNL